MDCGLSASRPRRAALVANGGLALAFAVVWAGLAWRGDFWKADFTAYYTGWTIILEGRGADLYDRAVQADTQARLLGGQPFPDGLLPYPYPPHTFPLAVLALLPLSAAFYVWAAVQAVVLLVVLRWAAGLTADWPGGDRLTAAATLLAFPPLFIAFQLGQLAPLLLLGLVGLYDGLTRGRPRQAALCLALLTLKPQYAVLPGALLLGGRRWRELGWFAAVMAAWAGLTTALLGWRCWPGWLGMVRHIGGQFDRDGVHVADMVNLKALLTAWLGSGEAALIGRLSAAALLAGAVGVLALWRGPWRPGTEGFDRRFALAVLLAVLLSPYAYRHDALLLALPALLWYRHRRGEAGAAVLLAAPALFAVDTFVFRRELTAVQPLVLLLIAWAVVLAVDVGPRAESG
jgi:hypothetical protein